MTEGLCVSANIPKVSILIPAFNQQAWIAACVASALAQSYGNLEVVVSDNFSTDDTEQIVREMLGDRRLRYHRNTANLGRVGNYRHLLRDLATGEWVLVLDGDDCLTNPGYIAHAVSVAVSDPAVVLVFGKILQGSAPEKAVVCNHDLGLKRLMDGNVFFLAHPPFGRVGVFHMTALYQRKPAIAAGLYDHDLISVDYEGFYRLILGRKLGFVDEVAGLWRQHGANTSQKYDFAALSRNFDAFSRPYADAVRQGVAPQSQLRGWLRQSSSAFYLSCMKAAFLRGEFVDVFRFTRRVVALDPGILGYAVRNVFLRLARSASGN